MDCADVAMLIREEKEIVRRFCDSVPYPSFEECLRILAKEIDLYAEYGEENHFLIAEIYASAFEDEELIQNNGKLILNIGGEEALWANSYALNRIMNHLISCSEASLLETKYVQMGDGNFKHPIKPPMVLSFVNKTYLVRLWEKMLGITS